MGWGPWWKLAIRTVMPDWLEASLPLHSLKGVISRSMINMCYHIQCYSLLGCHVVFAGFSVESACSVERPSTWCPGLWHRTLQTPFKYLRIRTPYGRTTGALQVHMHHIPLYFDIMYVKNTQTTHTYIFLDIIWCIHFWISFDTFASYSIARLDISRRFPRSMTWPLPWYRRKVEVRRRAADFVGSDLLVFILISIT